MARYNAANDWTDDIPEKSETDIVSEHFPLHGGRCFDSNIRRRTRNNAA